jgi:hypothetical protein
MRKYLIAFATFASVATLAASLAPATVIWNEGTNGPLSSNQAAPTPFTLSPGTNSVIGVVNGTSKSQCWLETTIPAGDQLSTVVLNSYSSTDSQGFTGFQTGSSFVGSPFSAGSYTGYTHFGTGATNGSLPPTNLVGDDLLSLMANPALAAGSTGFTPPLGPGNYTFLIQQLGASTNFQFDFNVTSVPEPTAIGLLVFGPLLMHRQRRILAVNH